MTSRFALNKANGKLMGVCAGIARSTGADLLGVRVIALLVTLFALGPIAILLYLLTAWLAESR